MIGLETAGSFGQLLREELSRQGLEAPVRRYRRGEVIFKQGDPPNEVYVVLEGEVAISASMGQSKEKVLSAFKAGDFFGEMAVIENDQRTATATAAEDTGLLCVSGELLGRLMAATPLLAGVLLRDVSRRLRGFDQQHVHEMREAERIAMLGNFTRSIVHDLKNPLNAIGLAAELFSMEGAAPEMRQSAHGIIKQQVERVVGMLEEILRVTEGGKPEKLEPTDFAAYIARVREELTPEFQGKGIALEWDDPPAGTLQLNPERLTHVFFNLFNNAADFMPNGGRIIIRFTKEPGAIRVEIEDSGPGLRPEIAKKLFTPFFTHGKKNGTGLGLSICKNVIEDHGGRIWARPEEGRGAIFCFSLPAPA